MKECALESSESSFLKFFVLKALCMLVFYRPRLRRTCWSSVCELSAHRIWGPRLTLPMTRGVEILEVTVTEELGDGLRQKLGNKSCRFKAEMLSLESDSLCFPVLSNAFQCLVTCGDFWHNFLNFHCNKNVLVLSWICHPSLTGWSIKEFPNLWNWRLVSN